MIADEDDGFDAGLLAFVDVKDHVDPAVRKIDDPIGDICGGVAGAPINIIDPLDVGLDGRLAERPARFRLDLGGQLLGFDLAVALEENPIDHVVFGDMDDDRAACVSDVHIGKQAGGVEILDAFVDGGRIGPRKVGTDCFAVDALIAFDLDRRGMRRRSHEDRHQESEEQEKPEEMTLKEFHLHPVPTSVVPIRAAGP